MEEENANKEVEQKPESGGSERRGLLTDLAIFALIVGLGLCAIYCSGYWPDFLKMVANLESGILDFLNVFLSNIGAVTDSVQTASQV